MRVLKAVCLWLSLWGACGWCDTPPQGAVASAHRLATQAGLWTMAKGGNAFDAAVAVGGALAVVEPSGSGLGGGGFYLLHRAADGRDVFLDARETAPGAASADMYLDAAGEPRPGASRDGPLAAGIPGVPAALVHLAGRYGRLPLGVSLEPAIELAREGFVISGRFRRLLGFRLEVLRRSPAASAVFLVEGALPPVGYRLRQPELAATLQRLAERGHYGFYGGETAQRLVAGVRAAGGIWTLADLAGYRVQERAPVRFRFGPWTITSAPPPSAGGIALAQALDLLGRHKRRLRDDVTRVHLVTEALRRVYRDRALYLGDPDFVSIPRAELLGRPHLDHLARSIDAGKATPSAELPDAPPLGTGGDNTTHFSILDRDGNRVAATLSINFPYGSGFMAPGTGVVLNNEMDDFATGPGQPNAYGLVGGSPNAIAPGKRMLSSMTPTFLDDGQRVAILGTPGGSRIVSMVLLGLLELTGGGGAHAAVYAPRYHHQYLPDRLQYEPGALADDELAALRGLGHTLEAHGRRYGDMQVVVWDRRDGTVRGASDPRGEGLADAW